MASSSSRHPAVPVISASTATAATAQSIDTTKLTDGYHYVDVRVFRHSDSSNAPAIYTDYKDTIYVDLHKPVSTINSFAPTTAGVTQNRQLVVKSADGTANSIHAYLDLPAATTDAQILNMVNQGQGAAGQIDTNLWAYGFNGIQTGNHVVTIVSYRPTGTYNIQRIPGQYFATSIGAGLGDLNFDGQITSGDLANTAGCFEQILYSQNAQFNPAADINGDGKINTYDLLGLQSILMADGVNQSILDTYTGVARSPFRLQPRRVGQPRRFSIASAESRRSQLALQPDRQRHGEPSGSRALSQRVSQCRLDVRTAPRA